MSRLAINLPGKFIFSTQIPIRIGDINRASHLSHVNLVQILEEARAQFMVSLGYQDAVNIDRGTGFILGDLAVVFKGQAYYGQALKIEIGAADIARNSFDMVYKVTNAENEAEVAVARTTILSFDYQKQKVIPLPQGLRDRLIPV
jgi:acyl-CoA thioester hydrolase